MNTENIVTGITEFQGASLLSKKIGSIVWVALRPIINAMGLDLNSQLVKIKKDSRFNCRVIPMVGTDGKNRDMMSLDAYQIPAFLYSINPNKVRKDLRERIITFQAETFKAINDYWNKGEAKRNHHVVIGYKSQIVQHNTKIRKLEDAIEVLKGQKALSFKNKDEKLDVIFKRTDELLKRDTNYGEFTSALQSHLRFCREYVDVIRIGGTEFEKFQIKKKPFKIS